MTVTNSAGYMVCDVCGQLVTTRQPCKKHPTRTLDEVAEEIEGSCNAYLSPYFLSPRGPGALLDGDFTLDELIRIGQLAAEAKVVIESNHCKS